MSEHLRIDEDPQEAVDLSAGSKLRSVREASIHRFQRFRSESSGVPPSGEWRGTQYTVEGDVVEQGIFQAITATSLVENAWVEHGYSSALIADLYQILGRLADQLRDLSARVAAVERVVDSGTVVDSDEQLANYKRDLETAGVFAEVTKDDENPLRFIVRVRDLTKDRPRAYGAAGRLHPAIRVTVVRQRD